MATARDGCGAVRCCQEDEQSVFAKDTVLLKNRRLTALPESAYAHADRVVELNLRRNQLQAVPRLSLFTSLTTLHLSSNRLRELPSELCNLSTLEALYASDNLLQTLPSDLGRLTRLRVLRLGKNQLSQLPASVGDCSSLEVLVLGSVFGGNNLTALPHTLGLLQHLRELDVSHNQLTALPPELGHCTSLTLLTATGNQLTALPSSLGDLPALACLNLAANSLTALPGELGQLRTLRVLDVRSNQLAYVPGELAWLKASTSLLLADNPFAGLALPPASPPSCAVPRLVELCGAVLLRTNQPRDSLPEEVIAFLASARPCTACRQPFFQTCLSARPTLASLGGHHHVPSMVSLCMPSCAKGCVASSRAHAALSW
eukprot:comp20706_c0_seq1/m.26999 comp20706_c0_seq1/g.26999  ORF comp20706_c0_seq1/g.26999 comp20706_c0_seq1/m.26999 type:complete len:373 (-) comp20706_c0_seq1:365-1483(-)